jgi:hypothetical protein
VIAVALATTLVGWLQAPDDLTAREAIDAAEAAYDAAGLGGVEVDAEVVSGTYSSGGDSDPVPVWLTSATLDGGTIALWLARADGEAVYLDDRTPDGSSQLLTERQARAIGDHDGSPAVGRQIRRNLALTVAAALIVVLAVRHARSAPTDGSRSGPSSAALADILAPTLPDPPKERLRDGARPSQARRPLVAPQRAPGRLRAEER